MSLNALTLGEREKSQSEERNPTRALSPRFFQFRRGWCPARGLIYSVVLHEVLFAATFVVPWDYWVPAELPVRTYEVKLIEKNGPLILPELKPAEASVLEPSGGASEGKSGGGSGRMSAPAGRPFKGIVHKGSQVIVSNPEHADNFVQTIRQPELINPPKLPSPLPFPNIVAVKATVPVLVAPSLAGIQTEQTRATLRRFAMPADALVVRPPVDLALVSHPKLEMPTVSPLPPLPLRRPRSPSTTTTTAVPTPPPLPPRPSGNADRDLLILSAIPTAALRPAPLPPGELHGAFAISPGAPTASAIGPSGMAIAGGNNGTSTGTGGGAGTGNAGSGTGVDRVGTGNGSAGLGKGTGRPGVGLGSGINGTGKGSGGSGGNGPATGIGPGSGPGATPLAVGSGGGGPFPGISIEGGSAAPITAPGGMNVRTPGTYALTIVGGGASGGGLKDYGVFHNETVYTIYADIAGTGGATWTLQYAVVQAATSPASAQGIVSPPYPLEKHAPEYPADLASQYDGRLIVIEGLIDSDGKVRNLRLIQTPHPTLAQALMNSLQKCRFGAAEIGNVAVPVKFLLGAPITMTDSVR